MTPTIAILPRLAAVLILTTLLAACGDEPAPEPTATQAAPTEAPAATQEATPAATATEPAAAPAELAAAPSLLDPTKTITSETGLRFMEVEPGAGSQPKLGDVVEVHYTGTLTNGKVFDSSYDRGRPIRFALGMAQVIPGWDEGIAMMKPGGKAVLVIPPDLAYGEVGAGDVIPPNSTLIFDVELVSVQPGAPAAPTAVDEAKFEEADNGLKYADLVVGSGEGVKSGQELVVDYTGWIQDGPKFDSSIDRGEPFTFTVGTGQVIPGWDQGLIGMQVGGKRQLVIPPELAYGEAGAGNVIPPNSTLVFEIELHEAH